MSEKLIAINELKVGDRILFRKPYSWSPIIYEAVVDEIADEYVKLRFASCTDDWMSGRDISIFKVLQKQVTVTHKEKK